MTAPNIQEQYVGQGGQLTIEGYKLLSDMETRLAALEGGVDPFITIAENEVLGAYGDTVSALAKNKTLLKFGNNNDIDGPRETIWIQGGDETYATSNTIDRICSSDAADVGVVSLETHTVTGTGTAQQFTFVNQSVTLNGQTPVALPTPCARVSRGSVLVPDAGDVYVFENSAVTAGVPNDATKIHLKIQAGDGQSFKAATTFSNSDYAFITQIYGSVRKTTSAASDMRLEVRTPGGIFLPKFEFTPVQSGGATSFKLNPYIIIPKNADVRLTGDSSTTNVSVGGGFQAILASVIG